MVVPAIDRGGHCPVFEIKVRGVAAGDAPVRVPHVNSATQAAHHSAGDRSNEVEVMCSLAP